MNKKVGNLIRGVVYDQIDTDYIKSEMFDILHCGGTTEVNNHFARQICDSYNGQISMDDAKLYLNNMNAIAALTGYDERTDATSNLIIPKKTLSGELLKGLDKVDLGKNLLDEYADSFFVDYNGLERNVTPEEISEDLDGELIDAIKNGKRVVFVADKDMTVSEFKENFANFIKELENAIKTA